MAEQKTTDEIGNELQRIYGSADPNTHIQCFYIRNGRVPGQPVDLQQTIATLQQLGLGVFKSEPEWHGIEIVVNPANGNERDHEKAINIAIREKFPYNHIPIMFSRACLYKEALTYDEIIPTPKIEAIINNVYEPIVPENAHIEYFYLFVQATDHDASESFVEKTFGDNNVDIHARALTVLNRLPGNWQSVTPELTWRGTFFGFFPKGMQAMTEREREKLLNGEVRLPLINRLEKQLSTVTGRRNQTLRVQVIITRACKHCYL